MRPFPNMQKRDKKGEEKPVDQGGPSGFFHAKYDFKFFYLLVVVGYFIFVKYRYIDEP